MTDPRMVSAQTVLKECFWGDYDLTSEDILDHIDKNEPGFNHFLFSKIIENSHYPSRHLRDLFPRDVLEELLEHYIKNARNKKRLRLIAANITGHYDQVPDYQWKL